MNTQDNFDPTEFLPLTGTQRSILLGQQLQPAQPLYNMVMCFDIRADLDLGCFRAAHQRLVKDCDSLRMLVVADQSGQQHEPKQLIVDAICVDLEILDFSCEAQPQQSFNDWLADRKLREFDVSRCQFDSVLIVLGNDRYVWYFNQHHLTVDAWSMTVIYRHMQALYQHGLSNQMHEVESLPKFAQYIVSEQLQRYSKRFAAAQGYWQQQSELPFVPSRFYRSVPTNLSAKTVRVKCDFGAVRSAKLAALASSNFGSFSTDLSVMQLFSTLLFAYLYRIGGNAQLSIGTPSHSRTSAALRDTAGLLISMYPLKVEVAPQDSFTDLYNKVAKANQQLLIHAVPGSADRHLGRSFDVVLNYISAGFGSFCGHPSYTEWVHPEHGDREHLLRLQVHDFNQLGEFTLMFDLNTDVFGAEEKAWVCEHFLKIADAMLDDPQGLIAAPPLADMRAILATPNQLTSAVSTSQEGTVLAMLAAQVKVSADSPALAIGASSLSYQQFAEYSDSFARALIDRGIQPGQIVALQLKRGMQAIVAIYGVLKAGASFLPIDSTHPTARVSYLIENSAAVLLITDDELGSACGTLSNSSKILNLTEHWSSIINHSKDTTLPSIDPSDRAYVIYTSGSTGNPKGVEITHASLCNYISWAKSYYLQEEPLDFALFTSLSFDLTITSLFVPLVSGAKLVIYPEQLQSGDLGIVNVIEDNRVDIIKLTPAHLSIVQSLDLSSSRIRKMIVGGDAFKTELASKISRFYGANIELYNEYGPTEATVACAAHRYQPDADNGITVPIGQPILGAAIYLLDKQLNQVPQGVAGDLYIAGAGLAKGYLGQPELTSKRFIQHPDVLNQRLYCSGDRARYNHKGELEYLGREDQQLKINGVRVELGEIEAALLNVAGVTDAAVEFSRHVQDRSAELHTLHCKVCGLEANHPSAQLDGENVCRICRIYEQQKDAAQAYFRDITQLESWITRIRQQSGPKQNAIMLLSGGKDSSYSLCKLVDMGLNPIVFTLDNGFISQGAKANIQRLVERLGLELVVGETPHMNEIFVDSLSRFSNVCNGCFKTIYTMATNLARERGIKVICTGLSRGQIFETRVAHLFQQGCFDSTDIDRRIIDARKAYHRTRDLIANRLDVKVFEDDTVFEDIQYLDFYRFVDVTLAEMYQYLNNIAPWIRPSDTGRSTNCLINDAGIYVHKKERGFHNYSLPYSWDVRLGHKERDAALEELDDEIDEEKVDDILCEIGYQVEDLKLDLMPRDTLIAYYVAPAEILKNTLQKQLAQRLLSETIPSQFVWMARLPLTANGKIDRKALPQPRESLREVQVDYAAPRSPSEKLFASLWQQILGVEEVGIDDNFFDLGGDSIVNIQIVSAARKQDIEVSPQQIFDYPTIRALAKVAGNVMRTAAEQGEISTTIALLPSQQKYFSAQPLTSARFNQHLVLSYQGSLTMGALRNAFSRLMAHHDGLRAAFNRSEQGWWTQILPAEQANVIASELDLRQRSAAQQDSAVTEHMQLMTESLDIHNAQLLAFAHILTPEEKPNQLAIMIHHLAVDGVSWWVLLQDLEQLLASGTDPNNANLPAKTSSLVQWCESLASYRSSPQYSRDMIHWQGIDEVACNLFSSTEGDHPTVYNTLHQNFSKALTRQLTVQIPASLAVQSQEVLITALVNTLLPYVQGDFLKLDIEGHGRESFSQDCDVTRTVGWFTSIFPILINKAQLQTPRQNLKIIKQSLRSAPLHGAAYGVSRYFANPENDLPEHPSQILFNYMGAWERTLDRESQFAFITPLCASHGHTLHDYVLQVNAMVFDDQLSLSWTYQSGLLGSALSQSLLDAFAQSLESLLSACLSSQEKAFTPTDFPTADIKQDDLDDIFSEFGED